MRICSLFVSLIAVVSCTQNSDSGQSSSAVADTAPKVSQSAAPPPPPPSAAVQQCLQCHTTENYNALTSSYPQLAGQSPDYLRMQLIQFRLRHRLDPTLKMNKYARDLAIADEDDAVKYFSKLKPAAPVDAQTISARQLVLSQRGQRYAAANCVMCHMNVEHENGPSGRFVPSLAGQSQQYLIDQLLDFKSNLKRNDVMHELATSMTYDNMEAVATFFALIQARRR